MMRRKMIAKPWSVFCVTEKAVTGAAKARPVSVETPTIASAPPALVAIPATSRTPAKKVAAKATFPPMKRIAPTMMSVGLSGVATMA